MWLVRTSLRRPVAMSTLTVLMVVFGGISYRRLGLDLMPQVNFPFVTVVTIYPGASAEDMESTVARIIEDAVGQIDGIRHLDSQCMPGVCQTLIEFELDRNVDLAAMDVREKIDLIRADLPEGVEDPKVLKFDINARPVVTLVLSGDRPLPELYDFADRRLRDRLSVLEGVASVELIGGAPIEAHVVADPARLTARGLTMLDLVNAVQRGHVKIPSGVVRATDRTEFTVTLDGEAPRLEDLGDLEVAVVAGQRVRLRDVAEVRWGTERITQAALYHGHPAVAVRVIKRGEANAVRVVRTIRRAYEQLQQELPGGMQLVWFRDDADFIEATVRDAWSSVGQGILLTGGILLLFLRDVRTALIAFITMPVSIVASFIVMAWAGYTLNTPTLTAFGISVGILVTNAIVVLENILRRLERDPHHVRGQVEEGASSVALAVVASAATNVVVFLPVAMMKSLSGRFLNCFGVVVTAATAASLLVSFTLVPMLAASILGRESRLNRWLAVVLGPWNRWYDRLATAYVRSLTRLSCYPRAVVLGMIAVMVLVMIWVAPRVTTTFVPQADLGELTVKLEFSPDRTVEETLRRAAKLAQRCQQAPEVRDVLVTAGKVQGILGQVSEGSHLAEISLKLSPKTERTRNVEAIRAELRRWLAEEPGVRSSVMLASSIGGASKMIEAKVLGDDLARLEDLGRRAEAVIAADPGAVDVESSVRPGRPELRLRPRREELHDLRWTVQSLALMLRGNVEGLKAGAFRAADRSYDIRVKLQEPVGEEAVTSMDLPTADGRFLPLGSLVQFERGEQPILISRSEKQRVVRLYADLAPGAGLGTVVHRLQAALRGIVPMGYRVVFTGMAERMEEAFAEFRGVTLLAIVLTYLLLAAILESWTQPFIIMTTVPFAYVGLFLGVYLARQPLSILGLLGGVMLIGVVVNNAILLMDEVNTLRRVQALGKRESMLRAARDKFRPIFMASVAAALGMLPMALGRGLGSELRASIGVGSFGGIVVSSILSLYFVPLYYIWRGRSDEAEARARQHQADAEEFLPQRENGSGLEPN